MYVVTASIVHKRDVLPDGTMIEQKTFTFTEKKVTYKQDWPKYKHKDCIHVGYAGA